MKKFTLIIAALCVVFSAACSSKNKNEDKKLYIEEGEYEAEMSKYAQKERRAEPPVVESDYIFRMLPQGTYYYDEKNMPLEDVVKTTADSKNEPRLWKRPKRYLADGYKASSSAKKPAKKAEPKLEPEPEQLPPTEEQGDTFQEDEFGQDYNSDPNM